MPRSLTLPPTSELVRQRIKLAPNGCWEWTARRNDGGYGVIDVGGKPRRVHRYVYELVIGPIPDGMVLDHLCRVRHCVNPAHLQVVTLAENSARNDTWANNRCRRGHPFTPENTYYAGRHQHRRCRECEAIRVERRQRAKKRAAA